MPNKWIFSVALALIASLTFSSGALHGYLDGRWTTDQHSQTAAKKLSALPEQCGPWFRMNDQELPSAAADLLRCHGYLFCDYWNSATGDRVKVAVLFGPRGPIAVHTPEICYSSAGTQPTGERAVETVNIEGDSNQFWRVQFSSKDDHQPSLDVWYAWSDGGAWEAREHPRFWMTNDLYKIQVAGRLPEDASRAPARDFLASFLPVAREAISAP